jgi:multidrug efflux pump subunit AcrA (membrane-fusion protein)
VKSDQTLELRSVTVERYDSDRVIVARGLRPGERVVTAGVHRLAAGEQVRPLEGGRP